MDTDAELLERCIHHDQRAWRELVERYQRLVYSIPARLRMSEGAREDVFQTVFLALFRNLGTIREGQGLAKWLITTTQRECWRVLRHEAQPGTVAHSDAHELGTTDASPGQDAERWEQQHAVHAALARLGGPCERLLRAVFLDRTSPSYTEISRRLGIPLGSIGPTRQRCLAKLAEILGHDWPA